MSLSMASRTLYMDSLSVAGKGEYVPMKDDLIDLNESHRLLLSIDKTFPRPVPPFCSNALPSFGEALASSLASHFDRLISS